jgi:WD40 repeat protein
MMNADLASREGEPKAKIFISYSRKDLAFVDRLDAALRARGFEPLIDRAEIYAFEDWWRRIEGLITKADTIVFVLSPDAVTSDICAKEVAFADSLNKRFAPVVCRRVDDHSVPPELRRLNFIFCDGNEQLEPRFDLRMDQLAEALVTDIDWIRKQTDFGEQARRWSAAGRPGPRGLLLRSPVLEEAERWIAYRPANAPTPTADTQAFIAESRCAATQRRKAITGSLGAGLILALGLAAFALWQRGIAVEQRGVAERNETEAKEQRAVAVMQRDQALITQSLFLADLARQQRQKGDASTALLLALEALPDKPTGNSRPYVTDAEYVLDSAWRRLRERIVLSGHRGAVYSAVFSPNGKRIVTASTDKTARLWDAETGKPIGEPLSGHEGEVTSAAFSPDGKRIVTSSSDKTVRLWDAETAKPIGEPLKGHENAVWAAAFSPDGKRIVTAGAYDNTARLWDAETGKPIGEPLRGHKAEVVSAAFSPDGKRIVTAGCDIGASVGRVGPGQDNTARLWNAENGKPIGEPLEGHNGCVRRAAFSPDGKRIVTASSDKTVRLWDAETGQPIGEPFKGHDDWVWSAAFSPDGKLIVTASSDETRIWDAETGQLIGEPLRGHSRTLFTAAFSPDGSRIVTASGDGTARVWDIDFKPARQFLEGHSGIVQSASFSPDGKRIVTASLDRTGRVWKVETGGPIGEPLRGHTDIVWSAMFSPDGKRILTASADKTARLWDAETGRPIGDPLIGHEAGVYSAAFSPNGKRIATASSDWTVRLWDADTARPIGQPLRAHNGDVSSVAFSPDGKSFFTGSFDLTVRLWDAYSGRPLGEPLKGDRAAFSWDGKRIVTWFTRSLTDKTVRLWDVKESASSLRQTTRTSG